MIHIKYKSVEAFLLAPVCDLAALALVWSGLVFAEIFTNIWPVCV